jgi:hypothetical protein
LGEFGRFHRDAGLASVIYDLIHRELGLEVVESLGPVQGAYVEIFNTELVLGEQGAEYEDRVVAARE